MKKIIFTLLSFCTLYFNSNAQYCGDHGGTPSGPGVCTPSGDLTKPGLSPVSDSLPPVINGLQTDQIIQFKNFDTIGFGGTTLTIQSLKVDTISNLPTGLCWATNKTNNTWNNKEDGCIRVTGVACDSTGQYKLHIWVHANVGFNISTDADAANLKYYVRCINQGDATPAIDSTQTSAHPFNPYGNARNCSPTGIGNISNDGHFNALSVVPNPFTSGAVVSFFSDKSTTVTERLTNMIGAEVYKAVIEVTSGTNSHVIERNNLPSGVYFYTVTDGKSALTKRIVISE